mmetsp:Transcript_29542/g.95247  ORF Transcript_29542/g.95247 Transcript_29542/m.95247 type:complete len:282 (+) Transcript_29542:1955-2800(+)
MTEAAVWLLLLLPTMGGALLPSVVIAPAQFGVPADYASVRSQLLARGHPSVEVAGLSRFDWLKIAPSIATREFWTGDLTPTPTLDFFYQGLDSAFAKVGEEEEVAVVGHSIGGWVARAYLAERGRPGTRLVTLGTPHVADPRGVDQTRGLVDFINANYPPSDDDGGSVYCVAGRTNTASSFDELLAKEAWDDTEKRSPLLESLVALPSYAAIGGENPFQLKGDGLIPLDAAILPGTKSIVLDDCHHSGFIPTALDSILLPDSYEWYGSPRMLDQWADALLV